jgi:hypothetical protein
MSIHLTKRLFLAFMAFSIVHSSGAQSIYVSTLGDDRNPGTKEKPVASFDRAQVLVSKTPGSEAINVIFASGTFYLANTVIIKAGNSMGSHSSVTYQAAQEGQTILSGGSLLNLRWQPAGKGIFEADVPVNSSIDQLYINGMRQRMARYPNAVEGKNVFDTWDLSHTAVNDSVSDPLTPARIAKWKNPEGGYIHAMHSALWGDMHWIIKGKNADGTLKFEGGWQNNRPSAMHPVFRMVENIFEELDAPGEWFFNSSEGKLYYIPGPGIDINTAQVEIVRLRHLIEFEGSKEQPIRNIHLKGFVFRHVARTFMDNKEPLLRSDWTVYRGGAIVFNGAEDCSITDCEFDQVGGNTIFVNNYNRRITIRGCYIHNSGANGIAFVGDPATVRSPIFRYGNQDYEKIDKTPGPKGDNFPGDCLVEDCLITKTGRDEKQTAPVQISISHKIRVSHCSIYDVPRAGINISEGTFGGHIIENCDIFNTVLETGDHGSFNSWGRDRYWTPDVKATCVAVAKEPTMPFWDMLEPNIIRNSRWRCDHGWDIDLDDGSTQYRLYNNLLLNGGLKMREGYDRIASNNIIINNGLHPHVWFINSGDVFKNNIVFKEYQPAIMDYAIAADGKWGKEIDFNFYVGGEERKEREEREERKEREEREERKEGEEGEEGEDCKSMMLRFGGNGCDRNSICGDPMFVDAANGDFRVKEGSPLITLGFVNFPMDQFGVIKATLKKIAKTPEIPAVSIQSPVLPGLEKLVFYWLGTGIMEITGNALSAFGVSLQSGGVALNHVPANSAAAKMGFHSGDLIQEVNGKIILSIRDMKESLDKGKNRANRNEFIVIRNQGKIKIVTDQALPSITKSDK